MAAGSLTQRRGSVIYRKRKPRRAIITVTVLAVTAITVWTLLISKTNDVDAVVACAPPGGVPPAVSGADPSSVGVSLRHDALDDVAPAPPSEVRVRVLNASTQRGAAFQASTALSDLGFGQSGPPADDPKYPNGDMHCLGQIRFGVNGMSAARTLSLAMPCTQLVRDNRQDTTVDLVVGQKYIRVTPNGDARQVLRQLSAWASAHPPTSGGQQAIGNTAPQISADLLTAAHSDQC